MKEAEICKCEKELENLGFVNNPDFVTLWTFSHEIFAVNALLFKEYYGVMQLYGKKKKEVIKTWTFNTIEELDEVLEDIVNPKDI